MLLIELEIFFSQHKNGVRLMLQSIIKAQVIFSVIVGLAHATEMPTHLNSIELPLVISVCSYNCSAWVTQNLDSIFNQDYENFRVIYIDDASNDTTAYQVEEYIYTHSLHDKLTLITNDVRVGKLKNIYSAFHSCDDQEIIVQVDADDWLPHRDIFKRINQEYARGDVWLTYSDFEVYPPGTKEWCVPQPVPDHIKQKRSYRNWKWVFTHLRTFYAWLYKNIKLEDFITELSPGFEGKFFPICNDMAAYFPMLEMCGPRFAFIPEKLYVYNRDNPNLGAKLQGHLYKPIGEDVRKRNKYPLVEQPIVGRLESLDAAQADVVILSTGSLAKLSHLINSLEQYVSHVNKINVITQAETSELQSYAKKHPKVNFINLLHETCNKVLFSCAANSTEQHILIVKDTVFVDQPIYLNTCIQDLERTQAHAFYFGFMHNRFPFLCQETGRELLPHQHVWKNIYAWKFRAGYARLCNNLDMTLFNKSTLLERITNIDPSITLCAFLDNWHQSDSVDYHGVGLFYDTPKLNGDLSILHKTGYGACPPTIPTHITMKEYVNSLLQFHTNPSSYTHWGPKK